MTAPEPNRYWYNTVTGRRTTDYNIMIENNGYLPDDETLRSQNYIPLDLTPPAYDPDVYYLVDEGTEVDEDTNTARIKWAIVKRPNEDIYKTLYTKWDRMLGEYLDKVAQAKGYDNRLSCYVRAGFSGPWQEECTTFASWSEQCYQAVYSVLEQIKNGKLEEIPNFAQVKSTLPNPPWPVPEETRPGSPE